MINQEKLDAMIIDASLYSSSKNDNERMKLLQQYSNSECITVFNWLVDMNKGLFYEVADEYKGLYSHVKEEYELDKEAFESLFCSNANDNDFAEKCYIETGVIL